MSRRAAFRRFLKCLKVGTVKVFKTGRLVLSSHTCQHPKTMDMPHMPNFIFEKNNLKTHMLFESSTCRSDPLMETKSGLPTNNYQGLQGVVNGHPLTAKGL